MTLSAAEAAYAACGAKLVLKLYLLWGNDKKCPLIPGAGGPILCDKRRSHMSLMDTGKKYTIDSYHTRYRTSFLNHSLNQYQEI